MKAAVLWGALVMMVAAWSGPTLAADPAAADPAAAKPEVAPQSLAEVWATQPAQDLLEVAIDRRGLGDIEGARERLLVLEDRGELPALVRYHLAICDELEERYAEALAGYTALVQTWPDAGVAADARYRRAVVLEDLDEHQQAVRQIKELERTGHWDDNDQRSMELVRGAAEVDGGHTRRGVRRTQRALSALGGTDELTWARARARAALTQALLDQAARVEIVNDRRARKRLVARAAYLDRAMDQVIAISKLGEPEYALAGLLALGDAYLALYDDLLAAPPPRKLDAEQAAIYQQELRQQVDVLQVKAFRFYDEGVSLATRIRWQGQIAELLKARRDALDVRG